MSEGEVIATGLWCEAEGILFIDPLEHDSEEEALRHGCGPVGHYGYECEGRTTTLRVVVVNIEEDS